MEKIKILSVGLMSMILLSTSLFANDAIDNEKVVDNNVKT